ncbi:MAG: TIM barrel protein [Planctomycetaceae bacterium]|nr:TIM barrel protein [Planctomycetaceae bacterium]
MKHDRRNFLKSAALVAGATLTASPALLTPTEANALSMNFTESEIRDKGVYINQYTLTTFYAREGIDLLKNIDSCFAELKQAGLAGVEATVNHPDELKLYTDALAKAGLGMKSVYTSPNLHDEKLALDEIKRVIAIAQEGKKSGVKIIVANTAVKEGKTDEELDRQNLNLNVLGAALAAMKVKLAMHYHTAELQFAGREFHSFMNDTDPKNVWLCFDTHWSYRASGNSAVSVYDHAKLYGDRVAELHLRQSQNGVWTETFVADADFKHSRVLDILGEKMSSQCHVVLEQAPENGTPHTLKPLEIFKQSVEAVDAMDWPNLHPFFQATPMPYSTGRY